VHRYAPGARGKPLRRPSGKPIARRRRHGRSVLEGYGGPAQPSPTIAQCLNGGLAWLEVECNRCKTRASLPLDAIRRPRDIAIWKLEAALKCRSCRNGRYAPPVHMVKLTERREITPCRWVHPIPGDGLLYSGQNSNVCSEHCFLHARRRVPPIADGCIHPVVDKSLAVSATRYQLEVTKVNRTTFRRLDREDVSSRAISVSQVMASLNSRQPKTQFRRLGAFGFISFRTASSVASQASVYVDF
jgi:hypothetical protein